jgi:DNA recombination protein RmuC
MGAETWAALAVGVINCALLVVLLSRQGKAKDGELARRVEAIRMAQEQLDKLMRDEFARSRQEQQLTGGRQREEILQTLSRQQQVMHTQLGEILRLNESKLEALREAVERRLSALQADNSAKLEQMRATVDEKLHATLEKRLGESFKLVGERLDQVHKGLGEMQALASGVGDLKKVLSNVKTRGTLGEIQLDALLEQTLSPDQYERNAAIRKGGGERVDFAVKLPDKAEGKRNILLPIDAKFPMEDYQRLIDAQESGDAAAAAEAMKLLEARVKAEAKSIRDKYIDPPNTTEFGILFLPTEGLYAEVLRRSGLWETLQRDFRVVVTGPTTLSALLNSLQMGFRTLAIQKRSGEVWQVLGAVKAEFGKFGDLLDKTQKKLQEASNTLDSAAVRTRAIERKLRGVEELPEPSDSSAGAALPLADWERAAGDS